LSILTERWFVHFQRQLQFVTPVTLAVDAKMLSGTISHYFMIKLRLLLRKLMRLRAQVSFTVAYFMMHCFFALAVLLALK